MKTARRSAGFTLIEVMIALFVIALGMGALLTTLTSSAGHAVQMRDRSFAYWVALNRLAELRLSTGNTGEGVTFGTAEFGGANWRWRQEISDPGQAGILRVDIGVSPLGEDDADSSLSMDEQEQFAPIATAYGFLGSSVARGSGIDPDWSIEGIRSGNPPGGPGGPGGAPGPGGQPAPGEQPGPGGQPGGPGGEAPGGSEGGQ